MSLTRDQWVEMWQTLKMIEQRALQIKVTPHLLNAQSHAHILLHEDIPAIKTQIQSVIGQMEPTHGYDWEIFGLDVPEPRK